MLIKKGNRYVKRTDSNPVYQYLDGNTYLQQWHRFITPNLTNYRDLYLSARGMGITIYVDSIGLYTNVNSLILSTLQ